MVVEGGLFRRAVRTRTVVGLGVAIVVFFALALVGSGNDAGVRGFVADVGNIGVTAAAVALVVVLGVSFFRARRSA